MPQDLRRRFRPGPVWLVLSGLAASVLIEGPGAVFAVAYNSQTLVSPASVTIALGATVQLTATVQPGCSPTKSCPPLTGTLTWDDGDAGGSFDVTACTFLSSQNLSVGKCTANYSSSGIPGLVSILATYSGNAAYSFSSGVSNIEVVGSGSSSTTSTTSSSTSSSAGTGLVEIAALAGVVVVALALTVVLIMRRSKSPSLQTQKGVHATLYSIMLA